MDAETSEERCSNQTCRLRWSHSGPCDTRTDTEVALAPTPDEIEQIEVLSQALVFARSTGSGKSAYQLAHAAVWSMRGSHRIVPVEDSPVEGCGHSDEDDLPTLVEQAVDVLVRGHLDAMHSASVSVPYEQIGETTKRVVANQVRGHAEALYRAGMLRRP